MRIDKRNIAVTFPVHIHNVHIHNIHFAGPRSLVDKRADS